MGEAKAETSIKTEKDRKTEMGQIAVTDLEDHNTEADNSLYKT